MSPKKRILIIDDEADLAQVTGLILQHEGYETIACTDGRAGLELARRERQAGTRTLNDILRAETDLINANSDAASAEADFIIAAFTVLNSMGRLTADHLTAVATR